MDYHTRRITYTLSYQEFLRDSPMSSEVPQLQNPRFPILLLSPSLSRLFFYHFQINYQSFLNKEPQSKPQALVLSNKHFDEISRFLSVLFTCLRLL